MSSEGLTFLSVILIHLVAVASPGPDFIIVLRNTLSGRLQTGLATAFGIALGNTGVLTACIFATTYLSSHGQGWLKGIKFVGAAYLAWIGIKCIRGWIQSRQLKLGTDMAAFTEEGKEITLASSFFNGVFTTLLNPKALMYYLSIVSQFINLESPWHETFLKAMTLISLTLGWFCFVACVMRANFAYRIFRKNQVHIEGVAGIILICFSVLCVQS